MTPVIALTALTALGLPGEPFHEPFHDPPQRPLRNVTTRRARAPLPGAADHGGAPSSLRAQNRSVSRVMALPGLRPGLPHMVDMQVIMRLQDRGALRLDHLHDQALCGPKGEGDL